MLKTKPGPGNAAISYQVNVYTANPNLMVLIYSKRHQDIEDQCADNGIEILSPHFACLRDGRASPMAAPEGSAPDTAAKVTPQRG